jgi:hypothetical protein
MKQIAQHFSFENLTNSRFFITSLRDGLMKAPAVGPAFRPFLKLAGALQDIPDTLQEKRIRDTFLGKSSLLLPSSFFPLHSSFFLHSSSFFILLVLLINVILILVLLSSSLSTPL